MFGRLLKTLIRDRNAKGARDGTAAAEIRFNLFNHKPRSREQLLDLVVPYGLALADLGHETEIDHSFRRDGLTIYVEGFRHADVNAVLQNTPNFALIATEAIDRDGGGFNYEETFSQRLREFERLASAARFILSVPLLNWQAYERYAPAFHAEPGWHEKLEQPARDELALADFAFVGTWSAEREKLCEALTRRGLKVLASFSLGTLDRPKRDQLIQSARWVIGLRPKWPVAMVSTTRISSALLAQRPVLYEACARTGGIADIPLMQPERTDLAEWLAGMAAGDWQAERARQLGQFRRHRVVDAVRAGLEKVGY
jgi:hypothetical protein